MRIVSALNKLCLFTSELRCWARKRRSSSFKRGIRHAEVFGIYIFAFQSLLSRVGPLKHFIMQTRVVAFNCSGGSLYCLLSRLYKGRCSPLTVTVKLHTHLGLSAQFHTPINSLWPTPVDFHFTRRPPGESASPLSGSCKPG